MRVSVPFADYHRSIPPPLKRSSRSRSPHDHRSKETPSANEEDLEDYEPFDAFEPSDMSEEDEEKTESIVYSDFNSLRNEEGENDAESTEDGYSFDSFDTGQTLASEDGEKAMNFLLETEKKAEVSLAPALFTMRERNRR